MLKKLFDYIKKDKYIILSSLAAGLIVTTFFAFTTKAYSENVQHSIANEVIRFHVLANSDSEADQALKLKVRDGVLEELRGELSKSKSKEETRQMLNDNIDRIIKCSEEIIRREGYNYKVSAALCKNDKFPTKEYGDIRLPAGEYEALRIIIGEGAGRNWWCVMFPPLCFVDVTYKEIPPKDKEELRQILTEDEYNLVASGDEIPVKVKFKIVEMWGSFAK